MVQGSYSLIEPDGGRRVVSYAADPVNGFNAVVQRDPAVKTTAVAGASVVAPSVIAAAAPVAVAVRPQVIQLPLSAMSFFSFFPLGPLVSSSRCARFSALRIDALPYLRLSGGTGCRNARIVNGVLTN